MSQFSAKTFKYFELARKNKNKKEWFEKNKDLYLENVREPFGDLILQIKKEMGKDLPRIIVDPQSITRPVRPKNRAVEAGGFLKDHSHVTIWEKKTSLFEWNPGIHIQFGAGKEDNFVGLGLYMVSSRQLSLLRQKLVDDFEEIDSLLNDSKLKKRWGGILGDKYKRFPKGFNAEDPRTTYLWNKQFYLGQTLTRKQVLDPKFSRQVVKDLKLAMPFFSWVREAVGVYGRGW